MKQIIMSQFIKGVKINLGVSNIRVFLSKVGALSEKPRRVY